MTPMRPRTTGRVLRGSALGLGLLVAGGTAAPALAVVDTTAPTTEVPVEGAEDPVALADTPAPDVTLATPLSGDFGTGKDFTVQVDPQNDHPADLDLSGAVFAATPVAGGAPVTCTTDQSGACRFSAQGSDQVVPAVADRVDATLPLGTYVLTQRTTTAGLALNPGSTRITLCDAVDFEAVSHAIGWGTALDPAACAPPEWWEVGVEVDSLFRTSLVTTVLDADTERPIAGAGYTLTAPDYPHRDLPPVRDLAGAYGDVQYPVQVSDVTGVLTFPATDTDAAWFLPGAGYTLTPTTAPDGYTADTTYAFAVSTTARQAALSTPVPLTRVLTTGLLAGAGPAPAGSTGGVAAGATVAPGAAATTSGTTTAAAGTQTAAALATTGSPVGTTALLGGGLVALGGGAMVAGSVLRRRARRDA